MGIEAELNFVVEKLNFFNRIDEVFQMVCISIYNDLLFHVDNLSNPNEVWLKIDTLFRILMI